MSNFADPERLLRLSVDNAWGRPAALTPRRTRLLVLGMASMNAPIAKDQLGFSLGELTYIDPTYDDESTPSVVAAQTRWVAGWFSHLVAKIVEWQHRRAVMQEMAMMSDRELSDIGLSRSDLARVFDPTFAANHARGRDYIAY